MDVIDGDNRFRLKLCDPRSPPQLLEQIVMVDDASTADAPHLQVFLANNLLKATLVVEHKITILKKDHACHQHDSNGS